MSAEPPSPFSLTLSSPRLVSFPLFASGVLSLSLRKLRISYVFLSKLKEKIINVW